MNRCDWCSNDPIYIAYHDKDWGVPVHDDRLLFELLILEGAQAGLSWITILKKRENYIKAFDNFDCEIIANYTEDDVNRLLSNPGIVRNRLKINSAIKNAKATLKIKEEFGSLDSYIWHFVEGKTKQNSFSSMSELPVTSEISDKMSKDMKKRGFNFVGSTILYAYMQSIGMVNDHLLTCFRFKEIRRLADSIQ